MTFARPTGIIPGVMTAFKDNYELDEETYREHLKWLIKQPEIGGLGITAGTGECYALDLEEFKRCAEIAVEVAHGKVHVWQNFGAECYEKAAKIARQARDVGVDGIRVIHPYFASYDPANLYDYYKDLAKEVPDISVMLYPQTSVTARPFPVEIIAKLAADVDNLVGAKISGSSYHWEAVTKLDALVHDIKTFTIVPGNARSFYHMARSGMQEGRPYATIGPQPQFLPELCGEFFRTCVSGQWEKAMQMLPTFFQQSEASSGIAGGGNIPRDAIGNMKYASKLLGRYLGPPRRPCKLPDANEGKAQEQAMIRAKMLPENPPIAR